MENPIQEQTIEVTNPDSTASEPPAAPSTATSEATTTNEHEAEPIHTSDPRRRVTLVDPRHEEEEEEEEDPDVLIDRALGIRPTTPQRESVIRDISKLKQQSKVRNLRKRFSLLSHAAEGDPNLLELQQQIAKFDQITKNREERTRKLIEKLQPQNPPGPSSPPARSIPSRPSFRSSATSTIHASSEQSVRKQPRVVIADAPKSSTRSVLPGNSNLEKITTNKRNSGRFGDRQKLGSATVTADFRREFQRRHTIHSDEKVLQGDEPADDQNEENQLKDTDSEMTVQTRARSVSDASSPQMEPKTTIPVVDEITSPPQNDQSETTQENEVKTTRENEVEVVSAQLTQQPTQETTAPTSDESKAEETQPAAMGSSDNVEQQQSQTEAPSKSDETEDRAAPVQLIQSDESTPQATSESEPTNEIPEIGIVQQTEQPEESKPEVEAATAPEPEMLSDEENAQREQTAGDEQEEDVVDASQKFKKLSHQESVPVIHINSMGDLSDGISTPLSARSQDDDSDGCQSTHSNGVSEPSKYMEKTPRWYTRVGKGLTLRAPRFLRRRKVSLENILQSSDKEKPTEPAPSRASKRFSVRDYAIHIKELETEDPSQLKSGWLHKKHGIFKSWRELFFVLKKDAIKYFKDQNQRRLAGIIRLDGADVVECPRKTHLSEYCFSISRRGKEIFVYTRSREDYMDWLLSIRDVIRFLQEENN